jgi:hypothetical protein
MRKTLVVSRTERIQIDYITTSTLQIAILTPEVTLVQTLQAIVVQIPDNSAADMVTKDMEKIIVPMARVPGFRNY